MISFLLAFLLKSCMHSSSISLVVFLRTLRIYLILFTTKMNSSFYVRETAIEHQALWVRCFREFPQSLHQNSRTKILLSLPFSSKSFPNSRPLVILQFCIVEPGYWQSLTHSRSWALLEEPPIVQSLKNFPAFYGTRRFITVFTRALHRFLSWAISIQSTSFRFLSPRTILTLSTHLRLGLPRLDIDVIKWPNFIASAVK
jgi:hypothetical protein